MKLSELRCESGFYKYGATALAQVWTEGSTRLDAGINYRCNGVELLRPSCVPEKLDGRRVSRMTVVVDDDRETVKFINVHYGRYPEAKVLEVWPEPNERRHPTVKDTYTVTYQVPTAGGNTTDATVYTCKDLADYFRCLKLGEDGKVKIISVSRRISA